MNDEMTKLRNRIDRLRRERMHEIDKLIKSHPELAELDDWFDEMYTLPLKGDSSAQRQRGPVS